MKISVITLFPQIFDDILNTSILSRAQKKGLVEFKIINLRDFGIGKHKIVDDKPYGGGAGMILKVDVLKRAIESSRLNIDSEKVILLDPQGIKYDQKVAEDLSRLNHIILVCGHYEGFDARSRYFADLEISIGDYVLTGGEIPSLAIIDSITRLIPGVLKNETATQNESFSKTLEGRILEGAQYTRPESFEGVNVPSEYLSGDPKKLISKKLESAKINTKQKRPDLLKK